MKKYFLFNQIDKTQIGDLQIEQIVSLIKTFKNVDDWHIWSPGDAGWTPITQSQVYVMFFANSQSAPAAAAMPPTPPPPPMSVGGDKAPEEANRLVSFADPNIDKTETTPKNVFDEEETFVDFNAENAEVNAMNAPSPIVEHKPSEPVQVSNYAEPEFEVFEMPTASSDVVESITPAAALTPEATPTAITEVAMTSVPLATETAKSEPVTMEPVAQLPSGKPNFPDSPASLPKAKLPESSKTAAASASPAAVTHHQEDIHQHVAVSVSHDERRKYPRIKARLRAIITNKDKTFLTHCKDISMGGISVDHNIPEYVFSGECEVYICGANGKESIVFKCTPVGESQFPNRLKFSETDDRYKDKLSGWLDSFVSGVQTKKAG